MRLLSEAEALRTSLTNFRQGLARPLYLRAIGIALRAWLVRGDLLAWDAFGGLDGGLEWPQPEQVCFGLLSANIRDGRGAGSRLTNRWCVVSRWQGSMRPFFPRCVRGQSKVNGWSHLYFYSDYFIWFAPFNPRPLVQFGAGALCLRVWPH